MEGLGGRCCVAAVALVVVSGAEYPSPKKVNLSVMVGLYKPKKVKGYLLSYLGCSFVMFGVRGSVYSA